MGRSLQNDLASDSARMLGDTTQFAINIRYTAPRTDIAVPLAGIWRVTGQAEVDSMRGGKTIKATAELQTAATMLIQEEAILIVNGEQWVVKTVGRVMFGQRTIYCQSNNDLHRMPGRNSG